MVVATRSMQFYGLNDLDTILPLRSFSAESRFAMQVVANVFPFRANNYVVEELIDWDNIPDDPIFQLTFPQKDMLLPHHFEGVADLLSRRSSPQVVKAFVNSIRSQLNPHPSGQMTDNVPHLDSEPVPGVQHKYAETCLVFPASGQTCHAYCTYCFRWPQFVGVKDLKFATDEAQRFIDYIAQHKELTDVLITGGDPMVMSAKKLAMYIEPLLKPEFEHIRSIRIGTKSISYWPYRYVTDHDADDVLRLFEKVVAAGKHLALMAHFNHWKELSTSIAQRAIARIRSTGVVIRTQAPLVRHVNDSPEIWKRMWELQVQLGCIPYYMFVVRNTGANHYFSVPLHSAYTIFRAAYSQVSGLSRTVRGPSMSAHPGKVVVDGVTTIGGEKVFALSFLQARNPEWCKRPFFARFDANATWFDQLQPAFGERTFFFQTFLPTV